MNLAPSIPSNVIHLDRRDHHRYDRRCGARGAAAVPAPGGPGGPGGHAAAGPAAAPAATVVPRLLRAWQYDFASGEVAWTDAIYRAGRALLRGDAGYEQFLKRAVHLDDLQRVLGTLANAIRAEGAFRSVYRVRFPDGQEHRVLDEAELVRDARGDARTLVGRCYDMAPTGQPRQGDVTEQRRTTLQGMIVERSGIPLFANATFLELFGFASLEGLFCRGATEGLIQPEAAEPGHDCEVALLRDPQGVCRHPFSGRRGDGTRIWGETIRCRVDWNGLPALQSMVVDHSERKQLEDALLRARSAELSGMLAAGMAHEFNNLLSVIQSYLLLIQDVPDVDAERGRLLGHIGDATGRGSVLVRKMLALARGGEPELAPLDLNEAVDDALTLVQPTVCKTVALTFAPAGNLPTLRADATAIQQIVLNLCMNASSAMPDGGTLTVETAREDAPADGTPTVRITVRDTGVGMSAAVQARLFEPYFSTRGTHSGSGLGLCVVRFLVERHGGRVQVESCEGEGTAIHVRLPALAAGTPQRGG